MFAVIYHWKLKEGVKDKDFVDNWSRGTANVHTTYNSFGSSLHKAEDGTYWAYARWPSREKWESMNSDVRSKKRSDGNKSYVDLIGEPITLDLLEDQLKALDPLSGGNKYVVPWVKKESVTIVVVGSGGKEADSIRSILEELNYRVDTLLIGSRKEFIETLKGTISTADFVILSADRSDVSKNRYHGKRTFTRSDTSAFASTVIVSR